MAVTPEARGVVLVLRALGLGDLLTAVPALRGLRRGFPEERLVLAAPAPLGELLPLLGSVEALHPTPDLESFAWNGDAPTVAVNLHGRGPQSTAALQGTGASRVWAHARPGTDRNGPQWIQDQHEVDRWCRLLRWCGIACAPADLLLEPPASGSASPGAVIIHPGAGFPARRWPWERFAGVARWAAQRGERVLITGSSAERGLAERVAEAAGLPEEAVRAGRTGLAELAALVAEARLVLCGDTGMAHLATAFRTPSVVLFGPVSPRHWGPPQREPRHKALWAGTTGDTFAEEPDPGLLLLTFDQVIAAVQEQLTRFGERTSPVGGAP